MQFIKTRKVKNPERNAKENAGIDFYIPEDTEEFRRDLKIKNSSPFSAGFCDVNDVEDWPTMSAELRKNYIENYAFEFKLCYIDSEGIIHIPPHKDVLIPTGIRSKFEPNLALIANNKSGIATKKKLIFGASVIDSSYQGEWHIHLISVSDYWQEVACGQKIIQFIPHLISTDPVEILDLTPEEFYTEKTSRGEGWQGSTGIK